MIGPNLNRLFVHEKYTELEYVDEVDLPSDRPKSKPKKHIPFCLFITKKESIARWKRRHPERARAEEIYAQVARKLANRESMRSLKERGRKLI